MHKVTPPPHFRNRRCQHRLIICGSCCNNACCTQTQGEQPPAPTPPVKPACNLSNLLGVMFICAVALVCLFYGLLPDEPAKPDCKPQACTSGADGFNPFDKIDEQINKLKTTPSEANKVECNLALLQHAAGQIELTTLHGIWVSKPKCVPDLAFRIDHSQWQAEPQSPQTKPASQNGGQHERSIHLVGSSPGGQSQLLPLAEAAIRAELFREYAYMHAVDMAKQTKDSAERDKTADDNKRDKFKTMLAGVLAVVFLIPLAIAFWRALGCIIGDQHWLTGFHESVAKSGESGADSKEGKKDGGHSWLAMIPIITLSGATAIGAYHTLGPGIGALPPANLTMPDSNLLNQLNQLNNLKAPEPDTSKFPGNELKVVADALLEQGRLQSEAIRELGEKQAAAAKTYAEAQTKTTADLANALKALAEEEKKTLGLVEKDSSATADAMKKLKSFMEKQALVNSKLLAYATLIDQSGIKSAERFEEAKQQFKELESLTATLTLPENATRP